MKLVVITILFLLFCYNFCSSNKITNGILRLFPSLKLKPEDVYKVTNRRSKCKYIWYY